MAGFWRAGAITLAIVAAILAPLSALAAGDGWEDLAGPLRALASEAGAGRAVQSQAAAAGVRFLGEKALVEVWFRGTDVPRAAMAQLGCTLRYVFGRRAEVLVPITALRDLAALPQVAQVAPAVECISLQGFPPTVSEGVQLTNASAFYYNDIRGEGARIAVIDVGFAGYAAAEIPIDPANPAPKSYRAGGISGTSSHGTAVAEVIADMAPDATIHLLEVDTPGSVVAALRDVVANKYHICCISIGLLDGPFDGSSTVSKQVEAARAAGVLVVTAAGNFAQRHWSGLYLDRNNDGICEFRGADDLLDLTLPAGTFQAYLSWYETAGLETDQDYDLVLLDASRREIARSAYTQNGDDAPREILIATVPAGTYYLQIHNVDALGADNFQLFVPTVDIDTTLQVPTSSLSIPAESKGALTVGASRGSTIDTAPINVPVVALDSLEPFSSRGPTVDGRLKPDLLGPDVVSTSVTGTGPTRESLNPFVGTSASAPHVAGAAALLYAEDEQRTAADLATALTQMAYKYWKTPILASRPPQDMSPDQDSNYGWGRLTLRVATGFDGVPPEISILYPGNGETVLTKTPNILALIKDNKTGVKTVSINLDGVPRTDFLFDPVKGVLSYTVTSPLSTGVHSVSITAEDLAGNVSNAVTHTFQVIPPSVPSGLQMITLPYTNLRNADPLSVFIPLVSGSIKVARWVPSDEQTNKYHVYPDPWASFAPPDALGSSPIVAGPPAGLGYFVSTPGIGSTLLNPQGQTVQSDEYSISLVRGAVYPQGWNMIGNPYTSAVQWGAVEFVTNGQRQDLVEAVEAGVTPGIIYEFKNDGQNGYYDFPSDPLAAVMHPFRGYWVHVAKDTKLIVYSPGVSAAAAPKLANKPWLSSEVWRLRLVTSAGGWQDPTLFIGAGPGCTSGYDAGRDVPKPPPLASSLQSYLPKSGWGQYDGAYAQDLRGTNGSQSWNLEVKCDAPNTLVSLTWPDLNQVVPKGVRLALDDIDGGKSVYMRTSASFSYNSGDGGVRHLRVRMLDDAGEILQISNVQTQALRGRSAVVAFSVTRPCMASVQVRNISGVVVRRLGDTQALPGQVNQVRWNGVSDTGAPVPPGRYLVCVTARTEDGQVVQGIRALQIGW